MEIKAVEMTRKIREQIHRETEGMSWPEYKAYVEARIGDFDDEVGIPEQPADSGAGDG